MKDAIAESILDRVITREKKDQPQQHLEAAQTGLQAWILEPDDLAQSTILSLTIRTAYSITSYLLLHL